MIDRIIEFSIRNRGLVIVAGFVLAVWGVYAVYQTPIDAIPNVAENQLIVFADWPGHSPPEIEDQVTYPLTVELQGLAGVRAVRSSSEFNFASLSIILDDSADFYFARQQVSERLSGAAESLPDGVHAYLAPDGTPTGQIFWYVVEGRQYDLGRLRSIQDWYVRGQLAGVPGVAEVASIGGHVMEYQIDLDPRRLAELALSPGMVSRAVAEANASAGGYVLQKPNAEYVVRGVTRLGAESGDATPEPAQIVNDLEQLVVGKCDGRPVLLREVAKVSIGPGFRRGVLELHGNEAVGGVVLMRYGENPLEVTQRLHQKIHELSAGLPEGVRVAPVYDRTPLIHGAVATVTGTLCEAIATATICVLIVLLHFRTSLVIAATLPLAALSAFVAMWALRRLGIADIQTNIMSLAGIVVSIGVLVDSSIVMAENVMHTLHGRFGDRPVRGDVRHLVLPACRTVGRPIFFSVAIMLVSFLPVFCLGGIQGKMFRPLAFTKSLAMLSVAVLAITLVPALCTVFIRGRLRDERQSWLVRSVTSVYQPVLEYLLRRPAPLVWLLGLTFIIACAPLGHRAVLLAVLLLFLALMAALTSTWRGTLFCTLTLTLAALAGEHAMRPLGWQKMPPLNEGMVMDMPITVPRASITEAADDLKARDMVLCRFPEVAMVVGKAGRAETPSDPAPIDMIETMVDFRPRELWPKRKLPEAGARRQTQTVLEALVQRGLIGSFADDAARETLVAEATSESLVRFDGLMREYAYQRNREFESSLTPRLVRHLVQRMIARLQPHGVFFHAPTDGEISQVAQSLIDHADHHLAMSPSLDEVTRLARHAGGHLHQWKLAGEGVDLFADRPLPWQLAADWLGQSFGKPSPTFFTRLTDDMQAFFRAAWQTHVRQLNADLFDRGTETFTRLAIEEVLERAKIRDAVLVDYLAQVRRFRARPPSPHAGHHQHRSFAPPEVAPQPELKSLQESLAADMRRHTLLWPSTPAELSDPGGELDRTLQMPGWANVWTRPIQNRVDMLFTGVNTDVGVRVLGRELNDVVNASEEIAAVLKQLPGAADVMAETVRGKGYLEIRLDHGRAARAGVGVGEVNAAIELALGGRVVTQSVEGRERHGVRVRYARPGRDDEESIRRLPIAGDVPLGAVAEVRRVEGPASLKSENGLLRNYVRLNVRGQSAVAFVEEARRAVADRVRLPEGVYLEWTGQFEHDVRSLRTLTWVLPLVVGLILAILFWTYRDLADALLMLLAVPGAIAGGVIFQWLLGYDFSITVLVGYIACFGMATSTGIIMLVYLREAVARRGGLEQMNLAELRQAVMEGAVHRLRPKLLTEATTILGLAPMLWATGVGAEVVKPMVAPVLGGILVADEVIDLLLPVLFFGVRRLRWRRLQAGRTNDIAAEAVTPLSGGPRAMV
ncbi:MAG TPA: efflux RND transporter permease subunit [Pirellulales bacterium]|nr:efflux RND transporter permease subunit [Pirellulales bacterium]